MSPRTESFKDSHTQTQNACALSKSTSQITLLTKCFMTKEMAEKKHKSSFG